MSEVSDDEMWTPVHIGAVTTYVADYQAEVATTYDLRTHEGYPDEAEVLRLTQSANGLLRDAVDLEQNRLRDDYVANHAAQLALGECIRLQNPPQFLLSIFGVEHPEALLPAILKTDDSKSSERAKLVNFYQWEFAQQKRAQTEFLGGELPLWLAALDQRFASKETKKRFSPAIKARFDELLGTEKLAVGLSVDTIKNSTESSSMQGYCMRQTDRRSAIALSPLIKTPEEREHVFTHEVLHVLEGVDTTEKIDGQAGTPFGLARLFGTGDGGSILVEAVIEHVADALIYGNWDKTHPTSRHRTHSKAYAANRALLDVLCNRGRRKFDVQLFIDATFEDGDHESPAMQALDAGLQKAFPNVNIVKLLRDYRFKDDYEHDAIFNLAEDILLTNTMFYRKPRYDPKHLAKKKAA